MLYVSRTASLVVIAAACASFVSPALAVDSQSHNLIGAQGVLQRLRATPQTPISPPCQPSRRWSALRAKVIAYQERSGALSADMAAQQWLALFDDYFQAVRSPDNSFMPREFSARLILDALPPSTAWSALSLQIAKRPSATPEQAYHNRVLQLIADTLNDKPAAQLADLAGLQKYQSLSFDIYNAIAGVAPTLVATASTSENLEAALNFYIDAAGEITFPDIVTKLGVQKSEALMRRAFAKTRVTVTVSSGDDTLRLAQRIALEAISSLETPQWSLVKSLDAGPLYEALDKKFPIPTDPQTPTDYFMERSEARQYYIACLIAQGEIAKATKLEIAFGNDYKSLTYEAAVALNKSGHGEQLYQFLVNYVAKKPASSLRTMLLEQASLMNHTVDRSAILSAPPAANNPDASHIPAIKALLSAGHLEEGVSELIKIISVQSPDSSEASQLLKRLGELTNHPEWIAQSRAADLRWATGENGDWLLRGQLLSEAGRSREAEAVYLKELLRARTAPHTIQDEEFVSSSLGVLQPLQALLKLYYKLGRRADVLLLLDKAPCWSAGDLKDVPGEDLGDPYGASLGLMAADTLAAQGHSESAVRILRNELWKNDNYDAAYALLAKLQGVKALPFLDQIHVRDRGEAHPLTWKAEILRRAGQLKEAETIALAAVAANPSDTHGPYPDYLRSRRVLVQIQDALGEHQQAQSNHDIDDAFQLAEHGEDLEKVGLLHEAVAANQKALAKDPGDPKIELALAEILLELNMRDEASTHFLSAVAAGGFSGRLLNRFHDPKLTSSVKLTLQAKLAKNPSSAKAHDVMASFYDAKEQPNEELSEYRMAVKLNPDDLEAWHGILQLGDRVDLSDKDRIAGFYQVLRLSGNAIGTATECSIQTTKVRDLAGLWAAANKARKSSPVFPGGPIYPLVASAAYETSHPRPHLVTDSEMAGMEFWGPFDELGAPSKLVTGNVTMQALGWFFPERQGH